MSEHPFQVGQTLYRYVSPTGTLRMDGRRILKP